MKAYLKQALSILIAISMLLTFAACGGNKKPVTNDDEGWNIDVDSNDSQSGIPDISTPTTSNVTTVTTEIKNADSLSWKQLVSLMPSELRGTTLNVYFWAEVRNNTGGQKVIDNFTKATGIKVKWTVGNYEQYNTNIAALINAGDSPDLIRFNSPNPARMYLCQDLKTATGYDFKGDIWDETTRDWFTVKGKTYGVHLKNSYGFNPYVLLYSAATVKNYDLVDPYITWKNGEWTYTKFKELCFQFSESRNRAGFMQSDGTDLFHIYGTDLIKFDGNKYVNNTSDPQVLKILQEICNNRDSGITCSGYRDFDLIENGTYLFLGNSVTAARRNDYHFTNLKAENNLRIVPFPQIEGVTNYQAIAETSSYGIPKGAKNSGAIYYFLRYYLDKENYDENMYFCNAQALEVYEWCVAQEKKYAGVAYEIVKSVNSHHGDLPDFIRLGGTAAQCKNELDSLAPIYQNAVDEANKLIAKF